MSEFRNIVSKLLFEDAVQRVLLRMCEYEGVVTRTREKSSIVP